jgi:hypothetical protein
MLSKHERGNGEVSAQTYIVRDANGRAVRARAVCADGRVRNVRIRGKRASWYRAVSGYVAMRNGVVMFLTGNAGE